MGIHLLSRVEVAKFFLNLMAVDADSKLADPGFLVLAHAGLIFGVMVVIHGRGDGWVAVTTKDW